MLFFNLEFGRALPDIETLVSENYARVYRFCARQVGSDDAADIAQETFVTMQKSLKRFNGKSSVTTWLLGIALNHCRNHRRKKENLNVAIHDWFDASGHSPESAVVDSVVLYKALEKLSHEHREVVLLHEIEELTYGEIAELTGVPEGTVKSRLHHAFQKLRTELCGGGA